MQQTRMEADESLFLVSRPSKYKLGNILNFLLTLEDAQNSVEIGEALNMQKSC